MSKIPALPIVLPFVVGIVVGYFVSVDIWTLFVAVIFLILLSVIALRCKRWRTIPIVLAFAVVGILLMQRSKKQFEVELPGGYASFAAVLTDNPQEKKSGLASEFYVLDGPMAGKYLRLYVKNDSASLHFHGQTFEPVIPQLGCTYHIRCRMKAFSGNNSYTFWARSHSYLAQGWVYPQNIKLVEATFTLPMSVRLPLKARLLRSQLLQQLFPPSAADEEETAILAAMAFGDKSLITAELRDSYSISGASHLLALSGMHLGILFTVLMILFGKGNAEAIYRPGRWSEVVSLWNMLKQLMVIVVIWLYVLITGMPASVVRAATMITIYSCLNAGQQREKMSMNALLITVMIMLMCNPMMIWDIGFQMSVFAMLAIFVFYPSLREAIYSGVNVIVFRIQERRNAKRGRTIGYPTFYLENVSFVDKIIGIILVSIAAQLGTAPLAMFYFGRFSTLFLVTNLVAIPLVTVILYITFLYVVLFLIFSLCAISLTSKLSLITAVLYFLAHILNLCMEHIASWGIYVDNIHINIFQLLLIYTALLIIYIMCSRVKHLLVNH